MGWRRGELWLETDVLWFREGSGRPAVAGFVPASLPGVPSAPGLVASRLRRARWKQRRNARRARATAVALSPAVMLALAARSGGDQARAVAAEDPPSLTHRVDTGTAAAAPGSAQVTSGLGGLVGLDPLLPEAPPLRKRTVAPADPGPKIDWHRATSVGLPYGGSLIDGTQLPVEGPNWVTWNPVTDRASNARTRLYGNEHTIRRIVSVTDAYRAANPQAPRVVIGDISREGGGPMYDEHVSHQNGLDLDGTQRAPTAAGQIDLRLTQDLLDRFVAAGAQMIFIGYSTGLHGPAGVVVPYRGHDYHMHVRFPPPGR
jgi:hypothetical protein